MVRRGATEHLLPCVPHPHQHNCRACQAPGSAFASEKTRNRGRAFVASPTRGDLAAPTWIQSA
eukprot:350528-Chlamydomonas_euryale.AAC.4